MFNPRLRKSFDARAESMRKSGRDPKEVRIQHAFHGTNRKNISKIAQNGLFIIAPLLAVAYLSLGVFFFLCVAGLLRVGHPKNPSSRVDEGWFGACTLGIYVSRYVGSSLIGPLPGFHLFDDILLSYFLSCRLWIEGICTCARTIKNRIHRAHFQTHAHTHTHTRTRTHTSTTHAVFERLG